MKYLVSSFVIEGIQQFYENVAKKYKHTYDYSLMHKNIDDATTAIYKIETELLRRKPSISKWNGLYMANTDKWYFAYKIEGDTIYVEDARHAQNMHEGLNRVINLMERMDNLPKRPTII